jgi:hypothetical protein
MCRAKRRCQCFSYHSPKFTSFPFFHFTRLWTHVSRQIFYLPSHCQTHYVLCYQFLEKGMAGKEVTRISNMPFQWQFQNDPLPQWFSHIFRPLYNHQTYRASQSYCHTGAKPAHAMWQIAMRSLLFDPHQKACIIWTTIRYETYVVSPTDSNVSGQHIQSTSS